MDKMRFASQNSKTLKKSLLFALLIMGLSFSSYSQKVSIGPKIGVSTSTGAGEDLPDNVESISAFTGGLFVKYNTDGFLAFQPELLYVRKGGYWNESSNVNYKLTVDYLQIPLLVKFQVPLGDKVFPFVYAGPYGAFQLSNEEEGQLFFLQSNGSADLKDFDAGASLGAGLDFELSSFFIGFDARYDIGMINIYEEDSNGDQPDIKNRTLSFMVSLGVNLD